MLNPSQFRDLVSGRRRGPTAALMRLALRAAEGPYALAMRWRNRRYDTGAAAVHRVGVPVVSVGNLTLGGTGKTPMVEWIARWFCTRGVRIAVVSRGYGAKAGSRNDEALELTQKLADVSQLQDPDRVAAARRAVEELGSQVIVLDDAFQHRRIHRDLDLVLVDALEPFGFGHVFPRGTLREPLAGLRRADVVALSRADMLPPQRRNDIFQTVARYAPSAATIESAHAPRCLLSSTGAEAPFDSLRGQPVAAFSGIGNPAGFRHTLEGCGYQLAAFREFPDHHRYTAADVASLTRWTEELAPAAVLCTHKDLVKLSVDRLGETPLWAVAVGLEILGGREALERRLQALFDPFCPPRKAESPPRRGESQ